MARKIEFQNCINNDSYTFSSKIVKLKNKGARTVDESPMLITLSYRLYIAELFSF